MLLKTGIHPDCPDSSNSTPLHYAAAFGWLHVVKLLVDSGAKIDSINDWNTTPAILAMLKHRFGVLDYLLELDTSNKELIDIEGKTVGEV